VFDNLLTELKEADVRNIRILAYEFVGSRITVANKELTKDSDRDILILVDKIDNLKYNLTSKDWDLESYIDYTEITPEEQFVSFRKDKVNIIATQSDIFYNRFLIATDLAKLFNLEKRDDRIELFQYVLYGNIQ
jgi:predicted nucleotidyltransferase